MYKYLFLVLAGYFISYKAAVAQQAVKGYVFIDVNQNKTKDRSEKGLPGVAVSNGREVVLSAADGSYALPVGEDNIIFIIKPRDYQVPVDENNLPAYFYVHKPGGSPQLKYTGVAPTGSLPAAVNFPLIPRIEQADFSALIFGDPQPYTTKDVADFSTAIIEEVKGIKNISFGLSLGDLVGDTLPMHTDYIREIKKVGIPFYNLMGNHDMNYDANEDSYADETFEAHFGPANYSFNYGNAHFIVLDDILYPDPRDGKGYWGGFREDQLDFVENDLKYVSKDKLIILAMHIPLYDESHDADGTFRKEDRNRLFALLKDFPNTLNLSAHTHLQRQYFHNNTTGWQRTTPHHEYNAGTTSGDWYSGELNEQGVPVSTMRDGTPKGYVFLHVNDNKYTLDYKVAGKPADYQIAIFSPKVVEKGRKSSAGIYANFFMGSEGDEVLYRIDNGDWKPMTHHIAPDPEFENKVYKFDLTDTLLSGRRPSNPQPSTHLWRADIPAGLSVGQHFVEVKATDMFSRSYTTRREFRVAEK